WRDAAQPPNAAHSATIPIIRILLIPQTRHHPTATSGGGQGRRHKSGREGLATYCFSAGGFASGVGAGASGSGVVPRSSGAATQSPAQILVPLTDPNSLQPIGADGLTCFNRFPPTLGAPV